MPEYWETAIKIAVYRPNEEIAKSWYRHVQASFRSDLSYADQTWIDFVSRCRGMSFEDFQASETMPTMEQYVDCEGVQVVSWTEAREQISSILGMHSAFPTPWQAS
ncbi:hypothetical protein SH449x_000759 [Pirellulaceae bacterium SH449]